MFSNHLLISRSWPEWKRWRLPQLSQGNNVLALYGASCSSENSCHGLSFASIPDMLVLSSRMRRKVRLRRDHQIVTWFLRHKQARHLPIDSPELVDKLRYLVCRTTPRNGSCILLCRRLDGPSRCPNPGSGSGPDQRHEMVVETGLPPNTWKSWYVWPMITGTVLRAQKELRDEILTSFVSSITFVFFIICPPPIFFRRFGKYSHPWVAVNFDWCWVDFRKYQ